MTEYQTDCEYDVCSASMMCRGPSVSVRWIGSDSVASGISSPTVPRVMLSPATSLLKLIPMPSRRVLVSLHSATQIYKAMFKEQTWHNES